MKRVADFKVKHDATIGASLTPMSEKVAMVDHRVVNVLTDRDQNGRRVLIAHIGGMPLKNVYNIICVNEYPL
jgi:hypothetical protein